MRSHLLVSFAIAAGTLSACNVPESSFGPNMCLPLDGPCTSGSGGTPVLTYSIVGLPVSRISTAAGAREDLLPGDSVTLYLVYGMGPAASDTVRTVSWSIPDGAVARITRGLDGSGAFVAVAPGATAVTANGYATTLFACGTLGCTMITDLRVVAPPSPP